MSNLPLEVITEILVRLPVKNLLRCRCVSKLWCLTISGSDFTKLYINHSLQTSSNLSIIVNNFHLCTIGDVDNMLFHKPIELNHPLMCYNHSIKVLGCCDGLFCISNVVDDVVLWNPCIRKHHVLPFLPLEINRYYGACLCRVYVFGFGYDCVSDDYKVVRIAQFTGIGRVSFESEVKVYSLRKNLWRRIGDMPYCLNYPAANGVFANGALHWVVSENPDSSVGNIIVALDLGVEDYRVVPKPEEVKNSFKIEVGVLRGSLCLLAYFKPEHVDVWVMNESWTKLLSVTSREVIGGIAHSFKPLVYSKSGYEVLMEHDNRMFWYDLRKKEVKNLRIRNMPLEYEAEVCFDSLISPYPGQPYNGRTRNEHGETSNVKKKDDFLSEGFKLVL